MDAGFVVVGARAGRQPAPEQRAFLERPTPGTALPFTPDEHLSWASPDGRVLFGAWQRCHPFLGGGRRWVVDDEGVAMCVGTLWPASGGTWPADDEWARRARSGRDHLDGIYLAVTIAPDGRVAVFNDPFGYRYLYVGERDGVTVAGSHASLVAWALSGGRPPARDVLGACSLAQRREQVGHLTGFAGVEVAHINEVVRSSPSGLVREGLAHPWVPDEAVRRTDPDELVAEVGALMAGALQAAAVAPAARRVMDLTGGKDSRVVLAFALGAGLADRFDYRTVGPPQLGDVQIASGLAARFGLRHEVEPGAPVELDGYADLIRAFVDRTNAMSIIWNARDRRAPEDVARVLGLPGEILRSVRPLPDGVEELDQIVDFSTKRIFRSRLGLLRPDAAQECIDLEVSTLLDPRLEDVDPAGRYHSFRACSLMRCTRYGVLEELHVETRIQPFVHPHVLRVALALGHERCRDAWAHFELIGAGSVELRDAPFAGEGWAEALLAGRDAPSLTPEPTAPVAAAEAAPPATGADGEPLMARAHRRAFEWRRQVYAEILDDAANDAWDVLDRPKTLDALERFDALTGVERQELFGAITAALWLGDDGEPAQSKPSNAGG